MFDWRKIIVSDDDWLKVELIHGIAVIDSAFSAAERWVLV